MRFFLDTEFLERGPGHPLELISLAVVAQDGRELYLANADFDPSRANDFVREHVLPRLPDPGDPAWQPHPEIARRVREFVGAQPPEWWGYLAAYDHVLVSQLFGDMGGLPEGWPYFTHELEQLREQVGSPELPPNEGRPHHALDDARWLKVAWEMLNEGATRSDLPGVRISRG